MEKTFYSIKVFEFLRKPVLERTAGEFLTVGSQRVPMVLVRTRRARRYLLRLRADGVARVTVPRGGSVIEARRFAERNLSWLEQQLQKLASRPQGREQWVPGTDILLRGESVRIEIEGGAEGESRVIRFGTEAVRVRNTKGDLRSLIERHLWKTAAKEFPERVFELAGIHQLPVQRVTVRNQRSRWGSCSRRGTISLNWRLIQAPPTVRDYLICHELAHLREMNHSSRFWGEVEKLCPGYLEAERWLKRNAKLLR